MRILIVATFFPPINSIASLRPSAWAKYWSEAGHSVTVLTLPASNGQDQAPSTEPFNILRVAPPFYSSYKSQGGGGIASGFSFKGALNGFRKRRGILHSCRMPDITDLWVRPALAQIIPQGHWDLVVSTSGPYTVHKIAHQLKRRGLASRWIADFRDLWSDNQIFPGLFPFTLLERYQERQLMRAADIITTVTPGLHQTLGNKHGVQKTHLIENGIDFTDFDQLDPAPYFSQDGKFRLVHTGTIYQGYDPSPLFKAVQELKGHPTLDKLEIVFAGVNGNLPQEVEQRKIGANVKFISQVKREEALRMQRDASALLFLPWENIEANGIWSGKIFEYFYWNKPIVAVGGSSPNATIRLSDELIIPHNFCQDVTKIKAYLTRSIDNYQPPAKHAIPSGMQKYSRKSLSKKMLDLVIDNSNAGRLS